jgi:pilus assembly protein CpaC
MCRIALVLALVLGGTLAQATADEPHPAGALVRVKVIDVDVTAARKMKFEMRSAGSNVAPESALIKRLQAETSETPAADDGVTPTFVLTANDPAHGMLNGLRQAQLAKIVAEPNVASAFGQSARFNSGGEFPVPKDAAANSVEMKEFGTRVETRVTEHGPDKAVVEVAVRLSEVDEKRSVKSGKFVVPALRVYETNTGFEGKWGETLVLCSKQPDQKKGLGEPHKIVRLLMVTPERIGPQKPAMAVRPGAGVR